jgi:hypothetical protein
MSAFGIVKPDNVTRTIENPMTDLIDTSYLSRKKFTTARRIAASSNTAAI